MDSIRNKNSDEFIRAAFHQNIQNIKYVNIKSGLAGVNYETLGKKFTRTS